MQPLVSVRVLTYNHEKYISRCLEGILMQKVAFPFEVIIGEDCSTDRTREIVFEYEKSHPDIIRVLASETVGSTQNAIRVHQACSGQYLAHCDGDDYWIDPLKLEKQVDYLAAHPECPMCFHDALIIKEGKTGLPGYFCPADLPEKTTIEDVLTRPSFIPWASMLARSQVLAGLPKWRTKLVSGDALTRLWCAHHGSLGYINEIMSVYRYHATGMTATVLQDLDRRHQETRCLLLEFDKETGYQYTALIQEAVRRAYDNYREDKRIRKLGLLYYILRPDRAVGRMKEYAQIVKLARTW
jgi:glycosyltransferase involved in cell wall biosynthesis